MQASPRQIKLATTAMVSISVLTTASLAVAAQRTTHHVAPMAKTNEQLVFYSAQGYDAAIAKAFQAKTGITVKLVDDSTGNVVAKIEAEKSNPHWDVAWFDGPETMQALDNEGLLAKGWTPSDVGNYISLGTALIPKDKAFYPTSITGTGVMAYNTKLLKAAQAPKDFSDLLSPRFKNAVAMNDPSISGPTYPLVAGIMQQMGMQKGEQYFTKLKQNGLKIFPTNDNTLQALLNGQVKVIMIQDSALVSAKVAGDPIQMVYPKSGAFTLPAVIGIDKNAPDADAARKFVEFVLSKAGQQVIVNPKNGGGDSYFTPIIKGVHANKARPSSGMKWIAINPVWAAHVEASLKKWFHENIVQ